MPTHTCGQCDIDWPSAANFARCPVCKQATTYFYNRSEVTIEDALDRYLDQESPKQRVIRRARWAAEQQQQLDELEQLYDQTHPEEATK